MFLLQILVILRRTDKYFRCLVFLIADIHRGGKNDITKPQERLRGRLMNSELSASSKLKTMLIIQRRFSDFSFRLSMESPAHNGTVSIKEWIRVTLSKRNRLRD